MKTFDLKHQQLILFYTKTVCCSESFWQNQTGDIELCSCVTFSNTFRSSSFKTFNSNSNCAGFSPFGFLHIRQFACNSFYTIVRNKRVFSLLNLWRCSPAVKLETRCDTTSCDVGWKENRKSHFCFPGCWQLTDRHQVWSIPPRHRNLTVSLFMFW